MALAYDYDVIRRSLGYGLVEDTIVPRQHKSEFDPEFKPAIPKDVRDMDRLLTAWVFIRPLVHLLGFGLCVNSGSVFLAWMMAPVLGGLVFQRSFTNAHNLVHGTYPLPKRFKRLLRELLMGFYGLMFGYASHLFKETHHVHHHPSNRCGVNDDPESVCHRPAIQVIAFGPYFTARIFAYGFVHAKSRFDRVVGVLELLGVLTLAGLAAWTLSRYHHGVEVGPVAKALSFYAVEAAVLLWLFPFNAAWLPHQNCYDTVLGQARNSPGQYAAPFAQLVVFLLVGGTRWHLLHHAYQYIPSCNLGKLADVPEVDSWMAGQFGDEVRYHRHHH